MSMYPRLQTPVGVPGGLPVPQLLWSSGTVIALGATSVATVILNAASDTVVQLCSSADCWITIGSSPTAASATAGCAFLPAGGLRYEYVAAGQKLAAIQSTGTGTLGIVPAVVGP